MYRCGRTPAGARVALRADVAHAGTETVSVARGEEQFDHESPKRRNDEIHSKLLVPSAGHAPGPLAGVRQRESASPRVPFFGLSSFRRFVSRFPSSRLLPIASQVPSHFQNRGQQKLNRRSRRSRRGGIARAKAAAHFSRSVRSQRGRPILFGLRDRDVLLFLFAFFAPWRLCV